MQCIYSQSKYNNMKLNVKEADSFAQSLGLTKERTLEFQIKVEALIEEDIKKGVGCKAERLVKLLEECTSLEEVVVVVDMDRWAFDKAISQMDPMRMLMGMLGGMGMSEGDKDDNFDQETAVEEVKSILNPPKEDNQ
jgi:hypothetical protein